MSSNEVEELRGALHNLSEDVHQLKVDVLGKFETIHQAVQNLAGKTIIPGPTLWARFKALFHK